MAGPIAALADDPRTVVVVGFMGAGKSTAARAAAEAIGATGAGGGGDRHPPRVIDVDDEIERRAGQTIAEIFTAEGEAGFRAREQQTILELLDSGAHRVLALGGGALTSAAVREALTDQLVVWIDVDADTAWARCQGSARPLATDKDRFVTLHAQREPTYAASADVIVPHQRSVSMGAILEAAGRLPAGITMLWGASPGGDYPAYIGPGLLGDGPGQAFWPATIRGRRFLVTDGRVGQLYGERLAPLDGQVSIMPGEQSKTVAHAEIVWSELARGGMTRADVVVALGGGVVGDLAGFCAATYQRGVRFVQLPTTLVAQVDSAYGGKTGVDLPEAKNYVGAFHQPKAVIADTDALATLPAQELAAGYAEVVKTALLAGGTLWDTVRAGAAPDDPAVVTACAHTKLRVVAADERDTGVRQTLNLGHTIGHAIETVTGYAAYRHGEAVGLGLLAALRLSGADTLRAEVADLLAAHGLPTTMTDEVDPDAVVMATARDKKRVGEGPVPFVLLDTPGHARPGQAVPPRELISAVRELAR